MEPQDWKISSLSSTNFNEYNTQLQGAALKATRNALAIPSDLAFHRSINPDLARDLDAFSARVLSLTNDILALVSTADSSQSAWAKGKAKKLSHHEDVLDDFSSLVVDSVDQLFERVVSPLLL
jgi:exosome complex exonuclease RRP6